MKLTRTTLRRARDLEPLLADTAEARGDVGYLPRAFVALGLPHSDPGLVPAWSRKNGDAVLVLQPGYVREGNGMRCLGYPFGGTARWLLLSICTQAVRRQSPNVELGESLRRFALDLGYGADGRCMEHVSRQLTRLIGATVQFQFRDRAYYARNSPIAAEFFLWRREESSERVTGFIRLSEPLFRDLIAHPVPVDSHAAGCLLDCPFAFDLFVWLGFRLRSQRFALRVSWRSLREQFGSDFYLLKEFSRHARRQLARVRSVWPELETQFWRGGVTFHPPSKLPVARRDRALATPFR